MSEWINKQMRTFGLILAGLLLVLLVAAPVLADHDHDGNGSPPPTTSPTQPSPPPPTPSQWDGGYSADASGHYSGKLNLRITNGRLQVLPSSVTTSDSTTYTFQTLQPIDVAKGYFGGTARMGSLDVTLTGRIDYPAPGENFAPRIVATFRVQDGHGGRFIGKLVP